MEYGIACSGRHHGESSMIVKRGYLRKIFLAPSLSSDLIKALKMIILNSRHLSTSLVPIGSLCFIFSEKRRNNSDNPGSQQLPE
jgi:hypothetical protein